MISGVILLATGLSGMAGEWALIKHNGRDHVSLENVAEFYELGKVQRVSNDMTLGSGGRTIRASRGSNELFINNLKFVLSYPVEESDGRLLVSRMDLTKVIEPVLRPSKIRNAEKVNTIILDAGHGGHDRGAVSRWGDEKRFNLDVANRARSLLLKEGFKVHMTRQSDVFIPLEGRVRFANKFDDALFVSVHFNSGQSAAAGLETYTLAPRGVPSTASDGPRVSDLEACPGNVHDSANMALATATHAALVTRLHGFDRGIKRARFVVIRDIKIPGVLVEGGFLSNTGESRRIASEAFRQDLAEALTAAILNYRKSVGPQAPPPALGPFVDLGSGLRSFRPSHPASPNAPLVLTPTAH